MRYYVFEINRKEVITMLNDIITLIQTLGFPIACVVALAWYVKELTDAHKEEITVLTNKLNEVCVNLTELTTKIDEKL